MFYQEVKLVALYLKLQLISGAIIDIRIRRGIIQINVEGTVQRTIIRITPELAKSNLLV